MKTVPLVSDIDDIEFVEQFLRRKLPVVVGDGLRNSPMTRHWDLDYFDNRFGHLDVAVSGDFFSPTCVLKLSEFLDLCRVLEEGGAGCQIQGEVAPYLRLAHPEFGGVDFTTIFFEALSSEWSRPYFMPRRTYFSPFALGTREPNQRRFPEWGLFISPRGALTSIHIDRTNDNAILGVTHGRKVGYLFEPNPELLRMLRQEHLRRESGERGASLKRLAVALSGEAPDYAGLTPHRFELNAGEVLFIPKRWAHEVFTLNACVTLTYNFIHFRDLDCRYLMHRLFGLSMR